MFVVWEKSVTWKEACCAIRYGIGTRRRVNCTTCSMMVAVPGRC